MGNSIAGVFAGARGPLTVLSQIGNVVYGLREEGVTPVATGIRRTAIQMSVVENRGLEAVPQLEVADLAARIRLLGGQETASVAEEEVVQSDDAAVAETEYVREFSIIEWGPSSPGISQTEVRVNEHGRIAMYSDGRTIAELTGEGETLELTVEVNH
ncbi:MAG: hypothetical protein ABH823_03110, partial [bacterium]